MASVCTPTINLRLSSQDTFNAWKTLNSSTLTSISPTAAAGTTTPTDLENTTLISTAGEIFDTAACIQEKVSSIGGITNQIQKAQEDILRLNREIIEAEADVAVARDRVAYIRNPEENTSFYESWFPIDRPMQHTSVPYFMGVTVFLTVFSLLVLLSLLGVNINVELSQTFLLFVQRIMAQFTWATLILFLMMLFIIYYFVFKQQS
jgi:hypothetical protein